MEVRITSYNGFDVRAIEITEAEARDIDFSEPTSEFHTDGKWANGDDEWYWGASDQESFYFSIDGGEETELPTYEDSYDSDPIRHDELWIEAVAECVGEFSFCFELDEEFDPSKLQIEFQHIYDQDFGVVTGMTYKKADGEEIYIDYEDRESRNIDFFSPMLYEA